ncbi:MAG: alpha/beta hydrolase [Pseudomonadota bacterium]
MAYVDDRGVRLWYDVRGDGEPLALIGGFGLLDDQFAHVTDRLADTMMVINWHYRGCGRSDRSFHDGLTLDRWVDDLDLIRRDLQLERIHLWGTSTGSYLALRYAARFAQQVASLITYPMFRPSAASRAGMDAFAAVAECFGYEALAKLTQWLGCGEGYVYGAGADALVQLETESFARNFAIDDLRKILAIFSTANLTADIAKVAAPTALLLGDSGRLGSQSRTVGREIEQFERSCPGTETRLVANGGGTYCMVELPAETASLVEAWIGEHPCRGPVQV